MSVRILNEDCLAALPRLAAEGFRAHSVVCDPPYGLSFMGKAWDQPDNVAFRPETWAAVRACMRPGAHLAAFGGTRTFHRMACAIEDAGFEIRDTLMWLYGSGFPKSLDVSKAIDRRGPAADYIRFPDFAAHYAERRKASGMTHAQVCALGGFFGTVNHGGTSVNWEMGTALPTTTQWDVVAPALGLSAEWCSPVEREQYEREVTGTKPVHRGVAFTSDGPVEVPITAPGCDASRQWQGWGTALKPAWEPIILARVPLDGTVAGNTLEHGCGGLNIDASRVGTTKDVPASLSQKKHAHTYNGGWNPDPEGSGGFDPNLGRWPANVLHDGSPEVEEAFARFGERMSGQPRDDRGTGGIWQPSNGTPCGPQYGDTGTASRFFFCAKADASDRAGSKHPTVKPAALMRWLVQLTTPPGGTVLDPFAGTGSTGLAADQLGMDAVLIERDPTYAADARRKIAEDGGLFASIAQPRADDPRDVAHADLFAQAAE